MIRLRREIIMNLSSPAFLRVGWKIKKAPDGGGWFMVCVDQEFGRAISALIPFWYAVI